MAEVQGRRVPLLPDGRSRRSPSPTTSRRRQAAARRPDTIAEDLPARDQNWNDAAIAADNPDAKLPDDGDHRRAPLRRLGHDRELHQVPRRRRRADGDGTLEARSGSTVEWPADTQAGNGNGGVSPRSSSDTAGAIGYVDLVRRQGHRPQVRRRSRTRPASSSSRRSRPPRRPPRASTVKADLTFFTGWADGDDAYPITAQTWIIAYTNQTDKAKGDGAARLPQLHARPTARTLAPEHRLRPAARRSCSTRPMAQLDNAARSPPDHRRPATWR